MHLELHNAYSTATGHMSSTKTINLGHGLIMAERYLKCNFFQRTFLAYIIDVLKYIPFQFGGWGEFTSNIHANIFLMLM